MSKFCQKCGSPLDENALFCTKCGAKTQVVCTACGASNDAGNAKCSSCGVSLTPPQQLPRQSVPPAQPTPIPPMQVSQAQPQIQPPLPNSGWQGGYAPASQGQPAYGAPAYGAPNPPKKSKLGAIVGISAGIVVVAAAIVILFVMTRGNQKTVETNITASPSPSPTAVMLTPFPEELVVDPAKVKVSCDYVSPEYIIPANYRSQDSIVFMQVSTDQGSTDLLIEVEIPGFTQKYEQKISVTRAETELRIHPPLIDGVAKTLNSAKDAQINVSVTDLTSGKIIVKDTKAVKLYSRYDMQWVDADGTPYDENILAWVTPEAEEVRSLLRASADTCKELTNGALDAIVGYQQVSDWTPEKITYVQAFCIMHTLAHELGVKYIMSPFSSTSSQLQRIATPSEVINSASGLCVETSVTIASALQAMNMHAVLILLPGHCQVAVETWTGSGNYFLIETTALTSAASASTQADFDAVMLPTPYTKDEWRQYLAQDGVTAIDCDLGEQLHIASIG